MFSKLTAATFFISLTLAAPRPASHLHHPGSGAGVHDFGRRAPFPSPSSISPTMLPGPTATGSPDPINPGQYTTYKGDGSTAAGWPDQTEWVKDFETMWLANLPTIKESCTWLGSPPDNSDQETQQVHDAIKNVAGNANVDPRFVLANMAQESNGCVRVKTTSNGHPNPGLMQSSGQNTCNSGTPTTPCPQDKIQGMIDDGITGSGGLLEALSMATGSDAQKVYQAAVFYNSGISKAPTANLAAGAATPCYASDIANRLVGFVGDSQCQL